MKIFLVGGGTGGPTAPLLAVAEELVSQHPKTQIFMIGTRRGLEKTLLETTSVPIFYLTVPAGKWRRYLDWRNFSDIFKTLFGFVKALVLIRKHQPNVVFGAGSFVQVPVCWAAYILGIPVIVHQQDFDLLLSTRLTAPIARFVTVTFSYTGKNISDFSGMFKKIDQSKIISTGNPVRKQIHDGSAEQGRKIFGLSDDYPTILVMGGGSGSAKINEVVGQALAALCQYVQVIHLTGAKIPAPVKSQNKHYHPYSFLTIDLAHAYAVADLVISRGGMSTIAELAALGKTAILVPLPGSPQEKNVLFVSALGCAIGLPEQQFTADSLVELVRKVLWDKDLQTTLKQNIKKLLPPDADKQIAKLILNIASGNKSRTFPRGFTEGAG